MAVMVGCATTTGMHSAETRSIEAVLEAAVEAGAETNATAARHLGLARTSLAAANQFASEGIHRRAYSMARRAEADAALATMLARESIAAGEADAAHAVATSPTRAGTRAQNGGSQ